MVNPRWRAVRKILCVRLDNIGDLLMTTPALRALKERFPQAEIVLLTSQVGSRIAPLVPVIDRWIVYDAPWVKTYAEPPKGESVHQMVEQLKAEQFDAAVIFTVYSQNPLPAALLTFMADIPLRLGYSHHNPYELLTDWVPDREPEKEIKHEVQRQLDLVATIGATTAIPTLALGVEERFRQRARAAVQTAGVAPNEPWLVLHPGVSEERRRYSAWGFGETGKRLSQRLNCRILVTGAAHEQALAEQVAAHIGPAAVSLAGQLALPEFVGLLAETSVLISNNSGPVHMAAALGTPLVDLYATTNPQHTPWLVDHKVLYFDTECKACARGLCTVDHGLRQYVQPQDIVQATLTLLIETNQIIPEGGEWRWRKLMC